MDAKPWLRHYDHHVPPTLTYPENDLFTFIRTRHGRPAEAQALFFLGRKVTYGELFAAIETLAAALYRRGVRQGHRVTLMLPNCPQMVIAYFAVLRLGAVVVMANPLNVERELIFKFRDSSSRVLLTLDLLSRKVNAVRAEYPLDLIVYTSIADYLPFPKNLLYPLKRRLDRNSPPVEIPVDSSTATWRELMTAASPPAPEVELSPDDLAVLIYSGGTTGISKGIMLSHRALIANLLQISAWGQVTAEDRFLSVIPLFHGFGMSVGLNTPLANGASIVLLPRFGASEVVASIAVQWPTLFAGVPTMFITIKELKNISGRDLTSLRGIFVGAAPLPLPVMDEFRRMTGASLIEGYGLTEAVTAISCNPVHGLQKPGTIGIPFPDVEWRIVDLETGDRELPPGEPGELILRCPELMLGYLGKPEATAATLRNGWLYTGDIGVMDEDGYVTIVDRLKDLIIVSGFNVYPSEIDEVLHQHPDVLEAVAVGLPHPKKGEYVKAYVVPRSGRRPTPEELVRFCKERLSPYMVPKEIELRTSLPKSMIGKILRRELREEEERRWRSEG